jgi:hypothetical protein
MMVERDPTHTGGRSLEAEDTARRLRRFSRIKRQLIQDRGGDPTAAEAIIAHKAAGLSVWCEEQLDGLMQGDDVKVAELTTTINTLRRLLETLGLDRRMKDVTPTLHSYIAGRSNGTTKAVAQ